MAVGLSGARTFEIFLKPLIIELAVNKNLDLSPLPLSKTSLLALGTQEAGMDLCTFLFLSLFCKIC
jgi:hypothetical protein